MTDLAAFSIAWHGPLALLGLAGLYKLGGESSFGSHSAAATKLAARIFDQLSGELEAALAPLVEEAGLVEGMLVDGDGRPLVLPRPAIARNEKLRNALDDYLSGEREFLLAYRQLKQHAQRIDYWCRQLRRITPAVLMLSLIACAAALAEQVGSLSVPAWLHITALGTTALAAATWISCASAVVLQRSPIEDMERTYGHL